MTCPARVTLDAAQLAFFDALPAEAPSVQSELGCELELGHEGSHAALGQQVDATMWWIQWTLSASEINPYTWCPGRGSAPVVNRDELDCSLFMGHPGEHSSPGRSRQASHAS
ncbi:hypothetical protein Aph02nite_08830 [Actinoplanes philippinensis]|uniref:Uncharacterized protein n=1 Tax=Actinoplanes philippinensis TaxID=35752 RepID=A0A1I2ADY5_9ACTN|nr:hypothetical protein Aph02nite_08830 [Actinoplanes philippinensis]SFE42082.1 hypothetical protein SAMN05421541_101657 [Actinoplanes philippinensis]